MRTRRVVWSSVVEGRVSGRQATSVRDGHPRAISSCFGSLLDIESFVSMMHDGRLSLPLPLVQYVMALELGGPCWTSAYLRPA